MQLLEFKLAMVSRSVLPYINPQLRDRIEEAHVSGFDKKRSTIYINKLSSIGFRKLTKKK